MKLCLIAALLAVAAAAPSSPPYPSYPSYEPIKIVSQTDARRGDGSSNWSYAGSDYTSRSEASAQKGSGYESGNTNEGTAYWVSPEGQKITISWVADEGGFRPVGDHLPTPPPIPEEIAKMLATLPKEPAYPAYP